MNIILASASPRRHELVARLGLAFQVLVAPHDESMDPAADPAREVARVSACKAAAVESLCTPEDLIIAADTIVVCQGRILGKPHSEQEAGQMLRLLSGREHQVMTGLTVLHQGRAETVTEVTDLHFRPLREEEIAAYIATGEPMDKAGSYGIQGLASIFVDGLRGDYYNVMGLPVCRLVQMLRHRGVAILGC